MASIIGNFMWKPRSVLLKFQSMQNLHLTPVIERWASEKNGDIFPRAQVMGFSMDFFRDKKVLHICDSFLLAPWFIFKTSPHILDSY